MDSLTGVNVERSSKDDRNLGSFHRNEKYSEIVSAVAIQFSERILAIPTKKMIGASGYTGDSVISEFASVFAANILSIPLLTFKHEQIRLHQFLSQGYSVDKKSELIEALTAITPAESRSLVTNEFVRDVLTCAVDRVLEKSKPVVSKPSRKFSICPNVESDDNDHHIMAKLDQMLTSSPTSRQIQPNSMFISNLFPK